MLCRKRNYMSGVLCLTVAMIFADQNLMAPNLSQIAQDFGFTTEERDRKLGGDIAVGFFIVGGIAALLVGYFADTMHRCILLGAVVIAGESACLATYWVTNYEQLFATRVITGISVGGSIPIIFSLLADIYPMNLRTRMSSIMGISMNIGISGGQLLAGLLGPTQGWRFPFIVLSIPALATGFVIILTLDEPPRGAQEQAMRVMETPHSRQLLLHNTTLTPADKQHEIQYLNSSDQHHPQHQLNWQSVKTLLSTPSVVLILCQGLPGCLPWGIIYVFLNDYFSQEIGLSISQSSTLLFLFGCGGIVGQACGGVVGQFLHNRSKRLVCVLCASSTAITVPFMLLMVNINQSEAQQSLLYLNSLAIVAGFLSFITGPNIRSILQNVTCPEIRGTAFALFALTDDIGKGAGPVIVVLVIAACNGSRREAFELIIFSWLFCSAIILGLSFTIVEDEFKVISRAATSQLTTQPSLQQN